jgi:hypothetical protein
MPDAAGNIRGIALTGKAGEVLEKIRVSERERAMLCGKLIRSGRNPIYCRWPKNHDGPCTPRERASCLH